MAEKKSTEILNFLKEHPQRSSREIFEGINSGQSYATVKRLIIKLLHENLIVINGMGKASRYSCSAHYQLFYPIEVNQYFEKEIEERNIQSVFNLDLINGILNNTKNEPDRFTNPLRLQ